MRQQYEFETTRVPVRALTHERQRAKARAKAKPGAKDKQIDLERIVWDPEYRGEILESMRAGA